MKAAVYRKFGGPEVVQIEERTTPVPASDEVLIKVFASTVSAADHRVRSRHVPKGLWILVCLALGIFRPRIPILGMDAAGIVDAVGDSVTRFKPGDEVIALLGVRFGGHAEYACVRESGAISLKPKNMNFKEAVTLVFGGMTAKAFWERAGIKRGDSVLVNGASGAVGTAAVQLAKHLGAKVTGVCSGANFELVSNLGADAVIDYTQEDFAKNGVVYDAIMDCVGNAPFERVDASIKPNGALLLVITDLMGMLKASWQSKRSGKLVSAKDWKPSAANLDALVHLAEEGAFRAVIDRTYDFKDIVEAHRYVDSGHKKGNVVLCISPTAG
jgi:NADPH:quinone reductase-like Zn-dependent oxidoreductase